MGDDQDGPAIDLIKFYTQTLTGLSSGVFAVIVTFWHNFSPLSNLNLLLLRLSLVGLFLAILAGLAGVGRIIARKGGRASSEPSLGGQATRGFAYLSDIRIPFLIQLSSYVGAMLLLLVVALTI